MKINSIVIAEFFCGLLCLILSTVTINSIFAAEISVVWKENLTEITLETDHYPLIVDLKEDLEGFGDNQTRDLRFNSKLVIKYESGNIWLNNQQLKSFSELLISSAGFLILSDKNSTQSSAYPLKLSLYQDGFDLSFWLSQKDYIVNVTNRELGINSPPEAKKALMVAAISYLYRGLRQMRHRSGPVCSAEHCMVMDPAGLMIGIDDLFLYDSISKYMLVDSNHNPVPAVFCAECGGKPIDMGILWGGKYGTNGSEVICPYCFTYASNWELNLDFAEISRVFELSAVKAAAIVKRAETEHVLMIGLLNENNQINYISGVEFRRKIGYHRIKSHQFVFFSDLSENRITVRGKGRGHGSGLCQMGMIFLAKLGYSWEQILEFYLGVYGFKIINYKQDFSFDNN